VGVVRAEFPAVARNFEYVRPRARWAVERDDLVPPMLLARTLWCER